MTITASEQAPVDNDLDGKVLGVRIRGFRLIRGLTLDEVSVRTGIPVSSLETYERGRRVPGGLRMIVIMNTLQLGPADLLYKTEV